MGKRARPAAPAEQKVEAVERALAILDAFHEDSNTLSLGELAERTGFYRSTILRLYASLERFGYLHRGTDGRFRLGPALLRLGVLYQNAFNLADYVRPVLAALVEETGETAAFYIREGDKRICLYRHHAPRLLRHHIEEGTALPLERGAGGRVLLAFTDTRGPVYDDIRREGFYISYGERDAETAAIAAPVFGRDRFLGALSIAGSRTRFDAAKCRKMTKILLGKAQALSKAVGAA